MGLWVHSLGEVPANAERDYYLYVLDYGWDEPLSRVLNQNLQRMMDLASRNEAVVIKGLDSNHFENEVFSCHGINGERSDEILPAILITTLHPKYFHEQNGRFHEREELDDKLLLIPLRKTCSTSDEVVNLIAKIFSDIAEKKELTNFSVQRQMQKKGRFGAFVDALVLEPNISGLGVDLKKLGKFFRGDTWR
jgi:hypothetical protein